MTNFSFRLPTEKPPVPFLIPLEDGNFKFRVDNSSLDIIKSCPREALYYCVFRRGRPTSPAQNMGSAVHHALEFLYRNGFTKENLTASYQLIDQFYQNRPITDDWRGPTFAQQVISQYFEKVGHGPFEIVQTPEGNPFVEIPFEIPFGEVEVNTSVPYSFKQLTGHDPQESTLFEAHTFIKSIKIFLIGKIDLAVRQRDNLFALDHKTTSRLGETFWSRWPISPQLKTYTWSLWKIYNELPAGAILNTIVVRKPTRTGTCIEFEPFTPFRYSQEVLEEWRENTLLTISNFFANLIVGKFPPNDANCIRMYGKCAYYDVCVLDPSIRNSMLFTSDYSPVQWDPTKE